MLCLLHKISIPAVLVKCCCRDDGCIHKSKKSAEINLVVSSLEERSSMFPCHDSKCTCLAVCCLTALFPKRHIFFDFFFALIVPDPSLRVIAERIAENLYLIGFPSLQDIYTVFYVLISFLVLPQVSHHGNKNRESCNEDQKSTNRAKQIKISNSG